jgi:hypothetical protein
MPRIDHGFRLRAQSFWPGVCVREREREREGEREREREGERERGQEEGRRLVADESDALAPMRVA